MSYLTFDIGTTALKTALVGDDGAVLAVHVEEYALQTPRPGWAEMDPEAYWRAAVTGTRAVLGESDGGGRSPRPTTAGAVRALGFSSQGQSFVALDERGRPLRPVIVWVDDRAAGIADAWRESWLPPEKYAQISGYPWVLGGLTLFKLAWLAQHEPAAHRAWKFLCLPDWLIFRLTGATATDYNLAQMTGMYDWQAGRWHPELLEAAGVTEAQLPEVLPPGTPAGKLTEAAAAELGLPAGLPVCVGCNDQLAGAVGAGNVRPGVITETTGTALAVLATLPSVPPPGPVFRGRHALPELFYAMAYETTSAIVLTWLRDLCAPGEDYAALSALAEGIPVGCEGLTVLPHFCGASFPALRPEARGAFLGLGLYHTRAHLVRAVLEACAFLLQDCLAPMQALGLRGEGVRSLGGAARSDLWLQMKADLLGLPVERPVAAEAASLGAALLAATGLGHFASLPEAAQAWYRAAGEFTPDPSRREPYAAAYARYRDWFDKLAG